jgi:hypothetical protein
MRNRIWWTGLLVATLAIVGALQSQRTQGAQLAQAALLDQAQEIHTNGNAFLAVESRVSLAQSFTAGRSGPLSRIELRVRCNANCQDKRFQLTAQIQGLANGAPDDAPIASAVVSTDDLPAPNFDWLAISFSQPPTLVAGSSYAIVLSGVAFPPDEDNPSDTPGFLGWAIGEGNPYPDGTLAGRVDNGAWSPIATTDATFRTFVVAQEPTSTPTSTATATATATPTATVTPTPQRLFMPLVGTERR